MDFQTDRVTETSEVGEIVEAPTLSGGRLTPARQTVLQILKGTNLALTHHEIEHQAREKGVQFDRVTLYRALEWLVTKDLAHKVAAEDRVWRFSAARDGSRDQAYFHCTNCGAVYCLEVAPLQQPAVVPEGFKAHRTEIMLRGECAQPTCTRA